MMITWRETLSYLKRSSIEASNSLLVVGSGGNGLSFAAHAANLGVEPLVMLGSASRKEAAQRLGVDHYIHFRDGDWREQLSEISPLGFDFVIDALGRKESAQAALEQVRRNGVLGIYGVDDLGQALLDPFKARGPFCYHPNEYDEADTHAAVSDFMLAGKLDAALWMDLGNPTPLEQIGEAYHSLRRKEHIKVLVEL
jgi:L-iditol 2-dehydrogenase